MGTIGLANVRIRPDELKKYYSSILMIVILAFFIVAGAIFLLMPWAEKYLGMARPMILLMLFHALGMAFVNFATMRYTYEKKAHLTFSISIFVAILGIALSLIFLQGDFTESTLYYGRAFGAAVPYLVLGIIIFVV